MAKGGAVDTEARGRSVMAGHARLRKYQIKCRAGYWLARVPYGSWNRFDTWAEASGYLSIRHADRVRRDSRQASVSDA